MKKGELIKEKCGKTKDILTVIDEAGKRIPSLLYMENTDRVTKNDNPNETIILPGKGRWATETNSNIMELLKKAGLPVAYIERISDTGFIVEDCEPIGCEFIGRRYADGKSKKRNPQLIRPEGLYRFHRVVFEVDIKTTGGKILDKTGQIICQTPLDDFDPKRKGLYIEDPIVDNPYDKEWVIRHPQFPRWDERSKLGIVLKQDDIIPETTSITEIETIFRKAFLVIERGWAMIGGHRLIDIKLEFGIGPDGKIRITDVIDNDSWRLRTINWEELSKQLFRDNKTEKLAYVYELVAELSKQLRVPKQAIVLWRGSKNDELPDNLQFIGTEGINVAISGHREPIFCRQKFEGILAAYPEGGVIIVLVGKSNGLGPTLAPSTNWSVISVCLTANSNPWDIFSSTNLPSDNPMVLASSVKNAILQAHNILSINNPIAYAYVQYRVEERDKMAAEIVL